MRRYRYLKFLKGVFVQIKVGTNTNQVKGKTNYLVSGTFINHSKKNEGF